ncbi:hypothetical protein U8326_10030 [Tsuneonella sp. CC-YZS046]|uniref:hypothetical protein n=1 Tax=Tsuneonella sp. CC-YZS046 TaxID=3042152 RepID=UPI002D772317|nr:hypothetical protein [Tsuneonella sp. CC-YZS046]WRO65399.1 hypothetical protein U8326_10030 [Tsuneonella sp. CC-YZS046]
MSLPPLPPGFVLDSDPPRKKRKEEDLPQLPEGFVLDAPAPKASRQDAIPSLGNITNAIDGDTLGLASGGRVRMWGMPNVLAGPARALDPVQRQRNTLGEEFMSGIPGLSDNLLPKRDIWGRPITSEGTPGPDVLSPFRQSTEKNDPVNNEMLAIGARNGLPSNYYSIQGVRHQWTPEQYDALQEIAGPAAYSSVMDLISSPEWSTLDASKKRKAVDKAFKSARETARAIVLGTSERTQEEQATISDAPRLGDPIAGAPLKRDLPPLPPGFVLEGDAGGMNIYADIQSAIPGIRITSGYRDEAYQADMRRRGYRPAQNSGHLSGSSLDLLPPPGKSMSWLKREVRKFHPDARMLDEGDHLHTTFPGYYGAPPLGGAKGAGLRNPLQGMPPPPPGFVLD